MKSRRDNKTTTHLHYQCSTEGPIQGDHSPENPELLLVFENTKLTETLTLYQSTSDVSMIVTSCPGMHDNSSIEWAEYAFTMVAFG